MFATRWSYSLVMDEGGGGGAGAPQGAEAGEGSRTLNFDAWIAKQDASVKGLVDEHVKGLKSALDNERTRGRDLEKQLRDAAAKLEKGSDAEKRLTELANQAADASKQATFYDLAHAAGATNLKLAWTAAKADDLFKKDGSPDLDALKKNYPELFARVPGGNGAGNGTNQTNTQQGGGMNNFIRTAAGRG